MTDGSGLKPIEAPRSLAEDAADRIREQILSGGFAQGERLVESRIAEQLNISRGPVREAFKLLRAEELLKEEPRRGVFVVRLEPPDVLEIYGLRAAVEGRAARLLAERGDPAAVTNLRDRLRDLEAAVEAGDLAQVSGADLAFHETLCLLSGNARLHEVFLRYVPMLRPLVRLDEYLYATLDDIATEHRQLLDAIASRDADGAAHMAEGHCDHAGELVAGYIAARSRPAGSPPTQTVDG